MATDKSLQYTAGIDDNPFAAAARRMGEHITGLGQRWTGLGTTWGNTTEVMQGHFGAVVQSVGSGVASMGGHFGSLLEGLTRSATGMGLLAVAGAAIGASKAVTATADMTESTMDLARVLGSSTNEARAWKLLLDDVGATQGELEAAAKGMSRQLKENEADMNAMGLQTRDAEGKLRPMTELLADGIQLLNGYSQGADRALAGQEIFGRGVDMSSRLLLVNGDALKDVRQEMQDLGLEVGANSVAAFAEFDGASDAAHRRVQALGQTVGSVFMPVMTDLLKLFNAAMPAAIVITRGALGGLAGVFYGVKTGVVVLWETINAMVVSIAEPLRAVVEALGRAMVGDFTGAATVLRSVPATIETAWRRALINIGDSADETRTRLAAVFMPDSDPGKPAGEAGSKTMGKKPEKEKKEKAEQSEMPLFENALAQIKLYYQQEDALREFSKQQELDYWTTILGNTQISTKDRLAIQKKTADLELQILREKAKEAAQLDQIRLNDWQSTELSRLALAEQAARDAAAIGQMGADALLQQELQLEQQRQVIREAALRSRLALLDPERDPVKVAEINSQLQALDQQHQLKIAQIRGQIAQQSAAEQRLIWDDLGERTSRLWDAGVNAMMNGTFRWANATRAVLTEMGGFAANLIKRMVVTWIFGEEAKTGATQAGVLTRWAMESWAAAKSVALWAATAVKNIMVSAWEAMAAAYKAVAGIPYVGPFLAPVMAGVAFAGVAAIASNIMSAEGGFDIPRGVNPIVQLHEQEMVLPKSQAQVIRDMADGGGGGGASMPPIELKGVSARDFFVVNRSDLIKVLEGAYRDNAWRPGR